MSSFVVGLLTAIYSGPETASSVEPTLAYIGPETLMPVASALAALGGLLLLFWRRVVGRARRIARAIAEQVSRVMSN